MKAVLTRNLKLKTPNLDKWLYNAHTAAFRLEHESALNAALKPHDQLSQLNVLVQLDHLMSYPIVREQVAAGVLHLSGWWFDIATGDMYAYESASNLFEIIDRQEAERLVGHLGPR